MDGSEGDHARGSATKVATSAPTNTWPAALLVACLTLVAFAANVAPALAASKPRTFQVVVPGGPVFTATLPADSVATYRWQPGASSAEAWMTTPEQAEASESEPGQLTGVAVQSPIPFTSRSSSLPGITVEPSAPPLQELTGFGGAMTESAADVIDGSPESTSVLELLFGSPAAGDAGLSIARVPIGPSDFTASQEPAAEEPYYTGADAERFTVPALQRASEINPALKLLATPWSAPPAYKVGKEKPGVHANRKRFCGGSSDYLGNDEYAPYANYLTEAVSFYAGEGLPVWMLSLQNEPHNCNPTYPTMELEPGEEAKLARDVSSDFQALANPPELLGWDHNWAEFNKSGKCPRNPSVTTYPEELFESSPPIQALGFHGYCGTPSAPGGAATGVPFYLTESTGEGAHPSASGNLPFEVQHYLIDPLRAGARGSLYWNLALNGECGPQYAGSGPEMEYKNGREICKTPKAKHAYRGCIACRPLITVDASGDYRVNQDYYYWAQLSRFLPPGARVIASSTSGELDSVAARCPNGAIVVTVLNGAKAASIPTEPNEAPAEELGTLGGHNSKATAVNESGQVVGWAEDVYGDRHAFSWTPAGGMVDLGALGGYDSEATAVNESGQVVGWSEPGAVHTAFSWTPAGGMVDLGSLGGKRSEATAVNNSGQVVGWLEESSGSLFKAFSWTSAGGMVNLGALGGTNSWATAVNNSGQVVGTAETSSGRRYAFSWTKAHGMVNLGAVGGEASEATAVNNSGQVVGWAETSSRVDNAFSWTKAGGMVDLGSLSAYPSEATAVNESGQVVGRAETYSRTDNAFSWTPAGGMIDLSTREGNYSGATAVNNSGQVVGTAEQTNGVDIYTAFSWTPASGMINLGTLGGLTSSATDVNNSGEVVGQAQPNSPYLTAALWKTSGS
jgi:probable HAF family extracellular repeat protein